jgi:hypothetical protein
MLEPDDILPAESGDRRRVRRSGDDDFFCLRFQLWYPSRDGAIRTRYRTCDACLDCDQGRFNARRHAADLACYRFPHPVEE